MSKSKTKQNWLRMHPVHFHIGMYVALAALLITMMKSSEGMIAAIYRGEAHGGGMHSDTHMREAETHIGHAQLNFARHPSVSGT
jgi:nitrate reductase gamma subunit